MGLNVIDLGLMDYEAAWKLQDEYAAEIAQGTRSPTLLLLEHPHVYTFGRRGKAENLLWGEEQLKRKGLAVHWVDRGGDVTYHGPGQLVGYPLLSLGKVNSGNQLPKTDYVGYVRRLEKTLIGALSRLGVAAVQRSGLTGVWIPAELYSGRAARRGGPEAPHKLAKLAAIGIKVDVHGVSRHGFALNVNPDMEYWDGIIACGLSEAIVSLADLLNPAPSMEVVKQNLVSAFEEVFEFEKRMHEI